MDSRTKYKKKVAEILEGIGQDTLRYDEHEYWMIQSAYEYIEYYADRNMLVNTTVALQLARGLHNGDHRKASIMKDGNTYRLPYVIHPLLVCRMLLDLRMPLAKEEEDILLAAALCHDMIEDIPFLHHGRELMIQYGLHPKVYETVLAVSKRKDFTEEEERAFFQSINENKLASLVKLSDRGHNVEDLYNMSAAKVREYVGETNKFFIPMCNYAKEHYLDVYPAIRILEDKIICLTEAAGTLVDQFEAKEQSLKERAEKLRAENEALRQEWKKLWKD